MHACVCTDEHVARKIVTFVQTNVRVYSDAQAYQCTCVLGNTVPSRPIRRATRRIRMADSWPLLFSTNTQFEFLLKGAVAASASAAAAAQG
eukprot:650287-Pelagomonas_calceolata.AAC.1